MCFFCIAAEPDRRLQVVSAVFFGCVLLSCQVVRDKRTGKTKGYGFVSFKDPNDYVRAMREMNGRFSSHTLHCLKYIGGG